MTIKNLTTGADAYDQNNDWFKDVDEVHGFDGDDQIIMGWLSGPLVLGHDDLVDGGRGNDTIETSLGNDILRGGPGNDSLDGGAGFDQLFGGDGHDTLYLSDGSDIYDGGDGYDILDMTFSAPLSYWLDGTMEFVDPTVGFAVGLLTVGFIDVASGRVSNIEEFRVSSFGTVFDDGGAHKMVAMGQDVTIDGRGGDDTIIALNGQNVLSGGAGNDDINGGSDSDTIDGGADNDFIQAGKGNDIVKGGTGDDIIDAGFGNDTIDGGDGLNDWLNYHVSDTFGTADFATIDLAAGTAARYAVSNGLKLLAEADGLTGIENVNGSSLNEIVTGTSGANHLYGHGGNDTIDGGYGNDVLGGDGGVNTVSFASWTAGVSGNIDLAAGIASRSAATLGVGGFTTGVVESDQLFGFQNVTGSSLSDTIKGDSGNNVLDGRLGNDTIDGGLGLDTIIGGAGFDNLKGGDSSDIFKFVQAIDLPVIDFASQHAIVRLEQIVDFQDAGSNQDVIDFSAIRTFNGGHLYLDDHDGVAFELGEIMTLTNGNGNSFISADTSGDGVVDLALEIGGGIITTLDGTDFLL